FIGHGAPGENGDGGLLLGADVEQTVDSFETRGIPVKSELLPRLRKAPESVAILDACFSGLDGRGKRFIKDLQPVLHAQLKSVPGNVTVLTAAKSDQFAGPLPGAARPAFSYLALGALRGWADDDGNGVITAGDVQRFVEDTLMVSLSDRVQVPDLNGNAKLALASKAREPKPVLKRSGFEPEVPVKVIARGRSPRDSIEVSVKSNTLGNLDKIAHGEGLGNGNGWGEDNDKKLRKYVSIGVSIGTGGGFITDLATPVNTKSTNISPGFSFTPFHTLLELDFWTTEWLGLGAFARLQIVEWAHLEGGRLKFHVVNNKGHQLFLRAGGGVGRVRHLIDFGDILDSTLEGPYFYTFGLCYLYNFSKDVGLALTPDFLNLFGDSPSEHIDINLGLIFSF
ncbi:hypothetical protein KKB55_13330, partial [Myxococcota bacterium]|nr:hypothetical protein [Myxococcota bacterium]